MKNATSDPIAEINQLEEARNYSEAIIETLWEPLVVLGADLRVKSVNKSFCDFFGLSKEEATGRPIFELDGGHWGLPGLRELLEARMAVTDLCRDFQLEHEFRRIGPKTLLLNANKITLKNDLIEKIIILTFQDVTEKRRAEQALEKIAEGLSFSNKELDDYASTAAHDLRSPLNKICIFAERLLNETISEKGQAYLKNMIESSNRMRELVESLLSVSRVTSLGHERNRISLEKVVKEVIVDLEIPIQETGAIIEQSNLPALWTNHMQMNQLFQNLIGNSIKYRKKGVAPRIHIGGRLTEDSVEITVTDNGIGFDEKYSEEVFKPFKRLHGASEYKGNGIGLALCQKIVRDHGGEITAKSRPEVGTTFTLKWPVAMLDQVFP